MIVEMSDRDTLSLFVLRLKECLESICVLESHFRHVILLAVSIGVVELSILRELIRVFYRSETVILSRWRPGTVFHET